MKSKKPQKHGTPHGGLRWTANLASVEFQINPGTLTRLLRRGDHVPGDDGKYSTRQICAAVFSDKYSEEVGKIRADRQLSEFKLKKEMREVIPAAEAVKAWEDLIVPARQKLLGLANKVESRFVTGMTGLQVRDMVDDQVREVLEEIAGLPNLGQTAGKPEENEADPDPEPGME